MTIVTRDTPLPPVRTSTQAIKDAHPALWKRFVEACQRERQLTREGTTTKEHNNDQHDR